MHTTMSNTKADYRERLSPSLWLVASAAVCAPMMTLVLAPVDSTLALIVGVLVGAAIVGGVFALSPVVEIRDGWLRVGPARIEVRYLGEAEALLGDDARQARGPGLGRASWPYFRGGVPSVVRVAVHDPDDPVTAWVFSSRTPERVIAVLDEVRARSGAR